MSAPVMIAVGASAVVLAVPVLMAAQVTVAGARAGASADAAAIAGADALLGLLAVDAEPCDIAEEVVEAVGGELVSCDPNEDALDVRVRVSVRSGLVLVTRDARAGPP